MPAFLPDSLEVSLIITFLMSINLTYIELRQQRHSMYFMLIVLLLRRVDVFVMMTAVSLYLSAVENSHLLPITDIFTRLDMDMDMDMFVYI